MGLFGNDKEQDARIDALESHVRAISEAIQQNQLDVASVWLNLIILEAKVADKISTSDVDPSFITLNEQVAAAREDIGRVSAAASDSWSTLHAGATDALSTLRQSVEDASERIERET